MRLCLVLIALLGSARSSSTATDGVVRKSGSSNEPDISSLGRGRRNKKKRRSTPTARWNALVTTMDGFLKKQLGSKHKKIRNHLNRVRNMADTNLPLPGARSPNCLKVEESKHFLRKQAATERKAIQEERRTERIESQLQRKEERMASKLFEDDAAEEPVRRRRDDDAEPDDDNDYIDYDLYPEYILDDGDDNENEFLLAYPDYGYEDYDEDGAELFQKVARGRRKKKGKKGGKIGPKRIWFNLVTAAKGFINNELKGCAEKKKFIQRVGRLAERVKKNAPILTAPVKKCRGRKCRKQNQG